MTSDLDPLIGRLDARMRRAIDELRTTISDKYPTATYQLSRDPDEPGIVLLKAILDLDDLDDVFDLVGEGLLELQVEEGIPVQVIPLWTAERVLADMKARDAATGRRPDPVAPSAASSQHVSS